ncbi:hypothetical protein JW824_02090 [bacterium]|nr:hypothetical protein [bacterium]
MTIPGKRILFCFLTFCLVILFFELFLIVASVFSPRINYLLSPNSFRQYIFDEALGHRPNPDLPGHDRNGFRNPGVPHEAKIVVLGDSQTYGTGVDSKETWPRQLEQLTGETVYNMAFGGYGPTHSLILWEEASRFHPEIVIEAFYSGNDLYDSFGHIYHQGQLPELRTTDKNTELNILKEEKEESIAQHISEMTDMVGYDDAVATGSTISSIRRFVSSHSKSYGLARQVKRHLLQRIFHGQTESVWEDARKFAEANPDYCQIFENGIFRTIFTSEYRLSALNLEDNRIAEGCRIALESINRMHQLAAQENRQFMVVLIPTKERVFQEFVEGPTPSYQILMKNEERLWKTVKAFLETHGIDYVDALPSLQDLLSKGIQPYKVDYDGHPNKYGHQAIADLLYHKIAGDEETVLKRGTE